LGLLQVGAKARLSPEAKHELYVFANFLIDDVQWKPLDRLHYSPPLAHMMFASDAAGSAREGASGKIGCGNVGFSEDGVIIFAKQVFWPGSQFLDKRDKKGCAFGQKSTTLEFMGVILPFILIPEQLVNKYVVIKVDNIACYFGWINRQAAGDETASVLIRALHLICLLLNCDVHIEHLPRMSNWEAQLVDRLSREATTTKSDQRLLDSFPRFALPDCIMRWLNDPTEDWTLCLELLESVKNKLKMK
jgi:hypothetical protein